MSIQTDKGAQGASEYPPGTTSVATPNLFSKRTTEMPYSSYPQPLRPSYRPSNRHNGLWLGLSVGWGVIWPIAMVVVIYIFAAVFSFGVTAATYQPTNGRSPTNGNRPAAAAPAAPAGPTAGAQPTAAADASLSPLDQNINQWYTSGGQDVMQHQKVPGPNASNADIVDWENTFFQTYAKPGSNWDPAVSSEGVIDAEPDYDASPWSLLPISEYGRQPIAYNLAQMSTNGHWNQTSGPLRCQHDEHAFLPYKNDGSKRTFDAYLRHRYYTVKSGPAAGQSFWVVSATARPSKACA